MKDMQTCETCPAEHPIDNMRCHGEVYLCPKCSGEAYEAFRTCAHNWRPETDAFGDAVQRCNKCGGDVPDDQFERIVGTPLPTAQLSS